MMLGGLTGRRLPHELEGREARGPPLKRHQRAAFEGAHTLERRETGAGNGKSPEGFDESLQDGKGREMKQMTAPNGIYWALLWFPKAQSSIMSRGELPATGRGLAQITPAPPHGNGVKE